MGTWFVVLYLTDRQAIEEKAASSSRLRAFTLRDGPISADSGRACKLVLGILLTSGQVQVSSQDVEEADQPKEHRKEKGKEKVQRSKEANI